MIVATAVVIAVLVWGGPRARVPTRLGSAAPRPGPPRPTSLSSALLLAAAQLRAGAAPDDAWRRALGADVVVVDDVPTVDQLLGARGRRSRAGDGGRATAVVVAAGAARALGAPLAAVLERVTVSVAADEEAAAELHAALAGPRATARVLSWLPVLGLLVSSALGADPVGVMLGGGLGTLAACLGLGLLVLGRLWTRALMARAATARAPARRARLIAGRGRA